MAGRRARASKTSDDHQGGGFFSRVDPTPSNAFLLGGRGCRTYDGRMYICSGLEQGWAGSASLPTQSPAACCCWPGTFRRYEGL